MRIRNLIRSTLDRLQWLRPVVRLVMYRLGHYLGSYLRLVGICLLGGGAIVGSIWTWMQLFGMIAPWPF